MVFSNTQSSSAHLVGEFHEFQDNWLEENVLGTSHSHNIYSLGKQFYLIKHVPSFFINNACNVLLISVKHSEAWIVF